MFMLFFYRQCACRYYIIILTLRDQNSQILNCTVAKLANLNLAITPLNNQKLIFDKIIYFGKSEVAETLFL